MHQSQSRSFFTVLEALAWIELGEARTPTKAELAACAARLPELRAALAAGKVTATGIRGRWCDRTAEFGGERHHVQPEWFANPDMTLDSDGWLFWGNLPMPHWVKWREDRGHPDWCDLSINRANVVTVWPHGQQIVAARELDAALTVMAEPVAPCGPPGLPGDRLARPQRLRPVPARTLEDWYCKRRDEWPDDKKHPSEAEDVADAVQHFTSHFVSRDRVRAVRKRHAPNSWTAHGRRKKLARE